MIRTFAARWLACLALGLLFSLNGAYAQEAPIDPAGPVADLVRQLPDGSYRDRGAVIGELAATGDSALVPLLRTLEAGELFLLTETGAIVTIEPEGDEVVATDVLTGEAIGTFGEDAVEEIRVNNLIRREVRAAVSQLTLMSDSPSVRIAAAREMFNGANADSIPMLDEALAQEDNETVRAVMEEVRAVAVLRSDAGPDETAAAVDTIIERGGRQALGILQASLGSASADVAPAIEAGIARIERNLALWGVGQNIWYGLSLGSVLLLAAIGLAITFGVMGVINMAHGEMVMLGAYTTYVVQEIIRNAAPGLFDYSLAFALPLAFLVTALVGIAIERGVIRFLYGRPLETLLATWGLSLIIQQAVRTIFGASNREVGNPSWMSGAFEVGGLAITNNRLWIIVFSLVVFAVLVFVMKKTALGLHMRAVTQNRRMASSMGIRTPWVDAMTFGLGSGVAGLAGVALSQISNVSPNLGQGYIIDSFMVVVFGGVGNLWGTLVGAFTLGVFNKLLEPHTGAVLAKVLVLVAIILFIQKRPRGLFALKGRAVEA
ncbi:urea ABC transporter permease subunit UrtB [Pararhizobium haloflavum]|uniref:urea ABC transporter permease subunit UrtB n=1 Tax=Pararhizobium haloflavum TaxID=2037914 RepID=UPI000C18B6D2|nr:urea ABC transporter permease subunit UrtB [Pararhizobium haloflavum]